MVLDAVSVFALYMLAAGVRTGGRLDAPSPVDTASLAAVAGLLQVAGNLAFAVYWRDWSVAGLEDLVALLKASAVAFLALFVFDSLSEPHAIPYAALFSGVSLVVLSQCALKLRPRWGQIARVAFGRSRAGENVIVVGAGRTGQLLARDLLQHGGTEYRIVAFLDDDARKWGTYLRGIRVEGAVDDLPSLLGRSNATLVIIALARVSGDLVRRVLAYTEGSEVRVRAVAGVSIQDADTRALRPLSIEELLQRESVDLDTPEARAYIQGRKVLITGAAGSIGSELARQVAALRPSALSLLDIAESGLHDVVERLRAEGAPATLQLEDIRDAVALRRLLVVDRPDVIFHAAAYKHVPILESAVSAAISTNIIGTLNLLQAAADAGVPDVVFISSDKAVQPTSVLGLTKRLGELLTIAVARASGRDYCVVRFGNVLGSAGSVVPIFERQIDRGGPITVTDPAATRFFMTIPEAVGLVVEAGAIARPGDVLVLDMGAPVPIVELARKMVHLRGLRIPEDIEIVFTGLRPGERLHEELFFPGEAAARAEHPRVLRAYARETASISTLVALCVRLEILIRSGDAPAAVQVLRAVARTGEVGDLAMAFADQASSVSTRKPTS